MFLRSLLLSLLCSLLLTEYVAAIPRHSLGIKVNEDFIRRGAKRMLLGSIVQIPGFQGWADEEVVDLVSHVPHSCTIVTMPAHTFAKLTCDGRPLSHTGTCWINTPRQMLG